MKLYNFIDDPDLKLTQKKTEWGGFFGRVHRNRSPFFLSCSKIIRSSHFQEHVGFLSYNIKISLVWSVACYAWSAKYHLFYRQVASIMLSSVQLPLVIYSNSLGKAVTVLFAFIVAVVPVDPEKRMQLSKVYRETIDGQRVGQTDDVQ